MTSRPALRRAVTPRSLTVHRSLDDAFMRGWARLTSKQADVLIARAQGFSRAQIAAQRDITESSVMNHIQDALAKLPTNGADPRARMLWVSFMVGRLDLAQGARAGGG